MSKLLTSKQAAEYLGYTEGALRSSRAKGKLLSGTKTPTFIKIGSSIRYKQSDLDQWIDNAQAGMEK